MGRAVASVVSMSSAVDSRATAGTQEELPLSDLYERLPHECEGIAQAIRTAGAELQRLSAAAKR
jgi:hypothetical protein